MVLAKSEWLYCWVRDWRVKDIIAWPLWSRRRLSQNEGSRDRHYQYIVWWEMRLNSWSYIYRLMALFLPIRTIAIIYLYSCTALVKLMSFCIITKLFHCVQRQWPIEELVTVRHRRFCQLSASISIAYTIHCTTNLYTGNDGMRRNSRQTRPHLHQLHIFGKQDIIGLLQCFCS